jgi:hypothetical protein
MTLRSCILIIGLVGTLAFGSAFVLSYTNPAFVETITHEVIRRQVERRVSERLDQLEGSRLASIAQRISGRNAAEIAETKRKLAEGLPAKIAKTISEMRNLDCECRKAIEGRVTGMLDGRIAGLTSLNERLELLIRTKYMETAAALRREFRIFSGANAALFLALTLTTLVRKRASLQLALPALVLIGAAGIVGFLYVFQQDWLHTIVFANYVGLGYFAYLGVAIALLGDIAFNRARLTTEAANLLLHAVGSAATALPC